MPKKIIHIMNYSSDVSRLIRMGELSRDDPYYFTWGWSRVLGEYVKKYSSESLVELWRPEDIKEIKVRDVNGVTGKIFPLKKVGKLMYCPQILDSLGKEVKQQNVVVHLHHPHTFLFYLVARMMKDYPLIAHHHGNDPPVFKYNFYYDKNVRNRILYPPLIFARKALDTLYMDNVDHFLTGAIGEKAYVSRLISQRRISFYNNGVNFDVMRPMNKKEARRRLGLPLDRKIILTVGATTSLKGSDVASKFFKEFRKKHDGVDFVWVGEIVNRNGSYDKLVRSGIQCVGDKHNEKELPLFYNAADIYATFGTHPSLTDIGGINNAVVEALGCNTPVVSMKLRNFKNFNDIKHLGYNPIDEKDLFQGIERLLEKPPKNFESRKYAIKYYSWDQTMKSLIAIYNGLFEKYYGHI